MKTNLFYDFQYSDQTQNNLIITSYCYSRRDQNTQKAQPKYFRFSAIFKAQNLLYLILRLSSKFGVQLIEEEEGAGRAGQNHLRSHHQK